MEIQRKIKESIPFIIARERINYLGVTLPRETKNVYVDNYKKLMKEMKKDPNRWRDTYVPELEE